MGNDEIDAALAECKKYIEAETKFDECPRWWVEYEAPAHAVYMYDYYIDVYEVTNTSYAECVQANGCSPPGRIGSDTRERYDNPQYDDYPVVFVMWKQAQEYCTWREARLPTEAEWEKAARGGLESKNYPWGDEVPVYRAGVPNGAKFDDDGACNETNTVAVGTYAANGYGIYDMAGDVGEWVADWHAGDYNASSPRENPQGPSRGEYRVMRGGSWVNDASELRAASRGYRSPNDRYSYVGFRCARSP